MPRSEGKDEAGYGGAHVDEAQASAPRYSGKGVGRQSGGGASGMGISFWGFFITILVNLGVCDFLLLFAVFSSFLGLALSCFRLALVLLSPCYRLVIFYSPCSLLLALARACSLLLSPA